MINWLMTIDNHIWRLHQGPSFQLLFHDSQAAALSLAHNAAQAEAEEAA